LITERFDDRRKTIYGELERNKGSTSKQITKICLNQINELVNRTTSAENPSLRPEEHGKQKPKQDGSIQLVPRIAAPLQEKNINGPPPQPETRLQRIEATAAAIARTHSSPENVKGSYGRTALKKGQEMTTHGVTEAVSVWEKYKNIGCRTPIGWIFRKTVRREANTTVFGTPYSRQIIIFHAITILANLTVASLKEDEHGQFQDEVPNIVRAFTAAINAVERYTQGLQVHWTDVEAFAMPEADRTKVPEVEELKTALREGLGKILGAFNEYLSTMGMTRAEIQAAKECVARPEMLQRRNR
jgi:nucleoporin NDC1